MFKQLILAGASSVWAANVPVSSNSTWVGNDNGGVAGGLFYFTLEDGDRINNGTGSCTVTSESEFSFLSGFGLWVDSQDVSSPNSVTFRDFGEEDTNSYGFLVNVEGNDAPSDTFLSLDCDYGDVSAAGSLHLSSFPNNLDDNSGRGNVACKDSAWESEFWIDFGANAPDALSFDSGADAGDMVGSTVSVSVDLGVNSPMLFFSANFTSNAPRESFRNTIGKV